MSTTRRGFLTGLGATAAAAALPIAPAIPSPTAVGWVYEGTDFYIHPSVLADLQREINAQVLRSMVMPSRFLGEAGVFEGVRFIEDDTCA